MLPFMVRDRRNILATIHGKEQMIPNILYRRNSVEGNCKWYSKLSGWSYPIIPGSGYFDLLPSLRVDTVKGSLNQRLGLSL